MKFHMVFEVQILKSGAVFFFNVLNYRSENDPDCDVAAATL